MYNNGDVFAYDKYWVVFAIFFLIQLILSTWPWRAVVKLKWEHYFVYLAIFEVIPILCIVKAIKGFI
jgi:hypothetical protein